MTFSVKLESQKGQSAIEYLTTYGWALLAIILVGGVLVQMGVFDQCQQNSPQWSGQEVAIESWAWTGTTTMDVTVQALQNDVNITTIEFDWDTDGDWSDADSYSPASELQVNNGDTGTLSVTGLTTTSGECAAGNVRITYDLQDGSSTGRIAVGSGTLRGRAP